MGENVPFYMAPAMGAADTSIHKSPAHSALPGSQPDGRVHGGTPMAQAAYMEPHFIAPNVQQGPGFLQNYYRKNLGGFGAFSR